MFYQQFCWFLSIIIISHLFQLSQQNIPSSEKSTLPVGSTEWTDMASLSPCNSWWGWGTGVLKWHLLSSHLWSRWSHWRLENTIRVDKSQFWLFRECVSILDSDLGPLSIVRFKVHEYFQNGLWPVGAVGQQPEVREGFLWCSCFPFHLRELITCKGNVKQFISNELYKKTYSAFCPGCPVFHSLNSMSSFPYPLRW